MPITAPVASTIQSGTGLLSSIWNSAAARKRQKETFAHNREMSEYEWQKNLEMWNRQNTYNDPSQQMARLKAAGLNPNMVYGSGSATGNTGSSMPKYNKPTADFKATPITVPQMLSMYQDFKQKDANINLVNENAKLVGKKSDAQDTLNNLLSGKKTMQDYDIDAKGELTKYSLESSRLKSQLLDKKVLEQIAKNKGISIDNARKLIEKEIAGHKRDLAKHKMFPSDNLILRMIVGKNKGQTMDFILNQIKSMLTGSMPNIQGLNLPKF